MRTMMLCAALLLLASLPLAAATSFPAVMSIWDEALSVYYYPDHELHVYDSETLAEEEKLGFDVDSEPQNFAAGKESYYLSLEDGTLVKYDLEGKEEWHFRSPELRVVKALEIGDAVAVATMNNETFDNEVFLLDSKGGPRFQRMGKHDGMITALESDGRLLYSASVKVKVWDPATGKQLAVYGTHDDWEEARLEGYPVAAMSIKDGMLYTGHVNGNLRRWDLESGLLVEELQEPHGSGDLNIVETDDEYLYTVGGGINASRRHLFVWTHDMEKVAELAVADTPSSLALADEKLYLGTYEGLIQAYEKGTWTLIREAGSRQETYDPLIVGIDKQARFNPGIPIMIGIGIILIIAVLLELRASMKGRQFSFANLGRSIRQLFTMDDLLKVVLTAAVVVAVIGALNPISVFPKYLPGVSPRYYFDIFIGSGTLLPIWLLLPPLLALRFIAGPRSQRLIVALLILILSINLWLLAPTM